MCCSQINKNFLQHLKAEEISVNLWLKSNQCYNKTNNWFHNMLCLIKRIWSEKRISLKQTWVDPSPICHHLLPDGDFTNGKLEKADGQTVKTQCVHKSHMSISTGHQQPHNCTLSPWHALGPRAASVHWTVFCKRLVKGGRELARLSPGPYFTLHFPLLPGQ